MYNDEVIANSVADLHSKILDAPPGFKFFQFLAVFWKINLWRVGAPSRGNPGSATGNGFAPIFSFLDAFDFIYNLDLIKKLKYEF